jgi:hypothetical protein
MATGTFLDNISDWNAKSAIVIKDLAIRGDFETASLLSSLRTTANDENLTQEVRLDALTALINRGQLLDIPVPPYYPVAYSFASTQTYVGLHNDLSGLNTGDYWHLTYAQYLSVLNKASISDITFANLAGAVEDNNALSIALNSKQDLIPAGTTGQFFGWDGAMRFVSWNNLIDKPTTLAGLGISSSDTLFDGRYVTQSSIVTSYTIGTNTPVLNTDSLVDAIGKLQAQVSSLGSSTGTISTVGLVMPDIVFSVSAPLTGPGGTINASFISQTGKSFFASPTAGNGLPTFREIVDGDLPVSGVTAGSYGGPTEWPTFTVDQYGRITNVTLQAATSGGTVLEVGLSVPSGFSVTNGPITTTGNLAFDWSPQAANYVLAGPESGSNAAPSFRQLVVDDIPDLPIDKIKGLDGSLGNLLTDELSDGSIWIGSITNAATPKVLSGDVTVSRDGVTAIGAKKVQYSMIQDVTSKTLLGRYSTTNGPVEPVTLDSTQFTFSNLGVIGLQSPVAPVVTTKGDLLGHDLTTQQRVPSSNVDGDILLINNSATGAYTDLGLNWVTMSGAATINAAGVISIVDNAITLGKLATIDNNTVLGNVSGGPLAPTALSRTQLTALINTFTSTLSGAVPAGGAYGATDFLNALGNWVPVTGTGTVTSVSVVSANGFAGTVATASTTPAITLTTTITGLLKGNGAAISQADAGASGDYISPGQITQTTGAGSGLTIATGRLLGRTDSSTGPIQAITVDATLSFASTTLAIDLSRQNTWTVLQQFPSIRLNGATTGFVQLTGPSGSSAANQIYYLPNALPTAGSTKFLTSDTSGNMSWQAAGGGVASPLTIQATGGASPGAVFDGSTGVTISYVTVGAQQLSTNLTSLAGLSYGSSAAFVKMTSAGTFSLDASTYLAGTANQYAVLVGGASNSVGSIATSSPNKILISNGTSTNPGWTTASYPDTTTQYGILYSNSNNNITELVPPGSYPKFLQWTGSGYNWADAGSGSGTVSSSTGGRVAYYTGSGASTTVGGLAFAGVGLVLKTNGTNDGLEWGTAGGIGTVTSVGLTMPSAFTVSSPNPITTSGTFAVTANGLVSQYIRGDGTLANFPTSGGGGSSLSYYLNGSVTQFGTYKQMSKVPVNGLGTNFTLTTTTGYQLMAQFVTDANDPYLLNIPAGAWDINFYFSSSNTTGSPTFYVELLKYDGSTFTPIANNSANAEIISNGTAVDLYTTSLAVSSTSLTITDRLAIRVYVNTAGSRTITFHTEDANLAQIITTFTTGLTALNGLTAQVQSFATPGTTGTAPNWSSVTATHTLNIPLITSLTTGVTAGLISYTDYNNFSNKMSNPMTTLGDMIYGGALGAATRLANAGITNGVYILQETVSGGAAGIPSWLGSTGTGNVVLAGSPTLSGLLTINASGGSGRIALSGSTSGTFTLQAPTTITGAGTYTLPDAYPVADTNYYLTSTTGGVLTWNQVTGGGDVTSVAVTSPDPTGNFAIFNSTTGKVINTPTNATLTSAGRATFNSGVDVGVNGTTIGSIVFRNNGAGGFTTTIQSSAAATASASYTWPLAPGGLNQVLQTDGSGNLSWTAAGTGDMTTTTNQTVTGVKTFGSVGNVGKLAIAGTTSGSIILAAPAASTGTVTFPNGTQTIAGLATAQSFTQTQTFTAGVAITTAGTFSVAAGLASTFGGTVTISTGTSGLLVLGPSGGGTAAPPVPNTRSSGTRVVVAPTFASGLIDYALGFDSTRGSLWYGSNTYHDFYVPSSASTVQLGATIDGYGITLSAPVGSSRIIGQINMTNTTMNFINFGNASTGYNAGAGDGPPTTATRSLGTKILLRGAFNTGVSDYAIGFNSAIPETWISAATGAGAVSFYLAATRVAWITGSGTGNTGMNLASGYNYNINSLKVVGARITGWGTPTTTTNRGALTSSSTTTDVLQVLGTLITDLRTHGLIGT